MSAKTICRDLRLWDAYRQADLPQEEAARLELGERIAEKALEEDAEPELREVAREHAGDAEAAAAGMVPWCKENTEPLFESDPW